MGKTHRNASYWWENRFKYGDPRYPEDTSFFDKRYQMSVRYTMKTYYHEKLDPRSMKIIYWAEMGKGYKAYAKRVARRNAKTMLAKEAHEIIEDDAWAKQIIIQDEEDKEFYNWLQYEMDKAEYEYERRQEELYYADIEEEYIPYDYDYDYLDSYY